MSIYTITSRFHALKPKVWLEESRLMARSSLLVQLLSIFSYCKVVCVDRLYRTVTIHTRFFWLVSRTRVIPFNRIKRIDYSFSSIPTSWSIWVGTEDDIEWFSVSLELAETLETVRLFSFLGEGAVETGWTGVLLSDDSIIDFMGDQEVTSRNYIDLLKVFTGKTLV